MGFRYQRRIGLTRGLGLNLSKSGVGASFRTIFGSVGTKGFSIRTGIPGLSWRKYEPKGGGSGAAVFWAILLIPVLLYGLAWVFVGIYWVVAVVCRLIYFSSLYVIQRIRGSGPSLQTNSETSTTSVDTVSPDDHSLVIGAPKPLPEPKPLQAPKPAPAPKRIHQVEPAKAKPPVVSLPIGNYELPPMSLLTRIPHAKQRALGGDVDITARVIIQTLEDFQIKTELKAVESGPVVTRYVLVTTSGVKPEKITALSNNLAFSLKVQSVRVEAPVSGIRTVGIEVPNATTNTVYLREILECPAWQPDRLEIPIVMGKDVGGRDIVADLAAMPHLLIAGATGSGKSVFMNSVISGLLMSRTPEQLQLMLIDPKIVEFSAFNHLPHLLGSRNQIITDSKKVAGALRWVVSEMEMRYQIMAKAGVRNIKSYNSRKIKKRQRLSGEIEEDSGRPPDRLSYVVVIIDELTDLMLETPTEIEGHIVRLAQMSLAAGIHLIIATNRPSAKVITSGIITHFPSKIAFQMCSREDSKFFLKEHGAETLRGSGDMLYMPPGRNRVFRIQGAMTSDKDIRKIVDFIKKQCPVPEAPAPEKAGDAKRSTEVPEAGGEKPVAVAATRNVPAGSFDDMLVGGDGGDEIDDELVGMAVQIIRETQRASTSSLQRRLRIGYTRAARVMDVLEERGIVGPARGSDPREILIDGGSPSPKTP